MAGWQNVTAKQRSGRGKLKSKINCVQINLQHSRLATDNLRKMKEDEGTYILCIQEPYTIGSKLVGLPRSYKALAAREGRKLAAIIINNKNIYTILINQLSDEDAVVMEAKVDVTLIIASMYFDINRPIETDLRKWRPH